MMATNLEIGCAQRVELDEHHRRSGGVTLASTTPA
jgi:hypothetical protein